MNAAHNDDEPDPGVASERTEGVDSRDDTGDSNRPTAEDSVGASAVDAQTIGLINKFLRDETDDHEDSLLAQKLRDSDELLSCFAEQATIHGLLRWSLGKAGHSSGSVDPIAIAELLNEAEEAGAEQAKREAEAELAARNALERLRADEIPNSSDSRRSPHATAIMVTAAALLIVGYLTLFFMPAQQFSEFSRVSPPTLTFTEPPVVGRLSKTVDAAWSRWQSTGEGVGYYEEVTVGPGKEFRRTDRYLLRQGYAHLVTEAGADVSLGSPCELEFLGVNHIGLIHGKLIGECSTPDSQGLIVDTRTRRIIDLGTEFGVWVNEEGAMFTEVFAGRISAQEFSEDGQSAPALELTERQTLAVDKHGIEKPDSIKGKSPFHRLNSMRIGIASTSESITCLPHPPESFSANTLITEDGAFVFQELRDGTTLPSEVQVTLSAPGIFSGGFQPQVSQDVIPAGTRIQSFLVHAVSASRTADSRRGRITFDGEILGVIANRKHWEEFVTTFPQGTTKLMLEDDNVLLEERGHVQGPPDKITISEDRRSLEFDFVLLLGCYDSVRVLVAMP